MDHQNCSFCWVPLVFPWSGNSTISVFNTKQSHSLFTTLESEWKYCRFAMYWANCAPTVILPWFYLQKAPLSLQRVSEKPENHRSELLLKYHRFAKFLLKYQDFRSTPHPQGGRPWPRGGKSTVLKPYGCSPLVTQSTHTKHSPHRDGPTHYG